MKRFKCSLQRVLDVREVTRTRCEAKLAESERLLQHRQTEQNQCGEALHREAQKILAETGKTIQPFRDCLAQQAWFQHLADRLARAGRATQKEVTVVGARRAELHKAMMEHKAIENLSRRERSAWIEKARTVEQKSMDEVAAQARIRRQKHTEHDSERIVNPMVMP